MCCRPSSATLVEPFTRTSNEDVCVPYTESVSVTIDFVSNAQWKSDETTNPDGTLPADRHLRKQSKTRQLYKNLPGTGTSKSMGAVYAAIQADNA